LNPAHSRSYAIAGPIIGIKTQGAAYLAVLAVIVWPLIPQGHLKKTCAKKAKFSKALNALREVNLIFNNR